MILHEMIKDYINFYSCSVALIEEKDTLQKKSELKINSISYEKKLENPSGNGYRKRVPHMNKIRCG